MSLNLTPQVSRMRPLFNYIKKQQENRKFIKTIEISATFFLITFFLVFALRPTIITISTLKGDIESKKILKEELRNKINQVITAQDLFSQVQERYEIVNSSLPDRPNYYEAASVIRQVGQRNELPQSSFTFTLDTPSTQDNPEVKIYSVSVGVKGPFTNALSLASEVLKSRRTDYVSSINFVSAKDSTVEESSQSASAGVSTRFSTAFYYWPPYNEKK